MGSLRLGFFLGERFRHSRLRRALEYRGVDRLPAVPFSGHPLWDEYWEAEDSKRLNKDLSVARELADKISKHGLPVEVIYVEVSYVPASLTLCPNGEALRENLHSMLSAWQDVDSSFVDRPGNLAFLGFDITHPVPSFHSVIRQPGYDALYPALLPQLNRHVLIGESRAAVRLADSANLLDRGGVPFCVVGVWSTSAQ